MNRTADLSRKTLETEVAMTLDLDGTGQSHVATGIGFFDHLLSSLAHHGMFDLLVDTNGDLDVDDHHTVEDTALVLGRAFSDALGDRTGIARFGDAAVPMDEALATVAVDVGGRPFAVVDLKLRTERIGALSTQMIAHALEAFARTAGCTVHVTAGGRNDHHVAEAVFKALGRALRTAVAPDSRRSGVISTKGTT
ncbi:MAG: imidazoleglycerol-phosphate dehydratase HisB [Acidimicrobiia bacterium]